MCILYINVSIRIMDKVKIITEDWPDDNQILLDEITCKYIQNPDCTEDREGSLTAALDQFTGPFPGRAGTDQSACGCGGRAVSERICRHHGTALIQDRSRQVLLFR